MLLQDGLVDYIKCDLKLTKVHIVQSLLGMNFSGRMISNHFSEVDIMLYEIKVQLEHIKPPIFRKLRVPSRTSLFKFHKIIQKAMGWENCHLYLYEIEKTLYSDYPEEWDMEVIDSKKVTLEKIFGQGTRSFTYEYDMGDGWRHDITFLKEVESEGNEKPACITGTRACPPEDCGGPPGYEYFLEVIADSSHEDHDEMLAWIGGSFNPEYFNLEETNKAVKQVR
jgi:hypothetical protein